jgi:hypothetical protein
MKLTIEPRQASLFLAAIALFLIFAAVMGLLSVYVLGYDYVFGLIDFFNLNNENNLPTFFSALVLLLCSLLLFVIASSRKSSGQPAGYWLGLALIFLFLSIDEDASIHEVLIVPVRTMLEVSGPFYYAWVIPYGLVVLAIGVAYIPFLFRLPRNIRRLIVIAGSVFVSGALGVELIEGWYYAAHDETEDLVYELLVTLEESLEMLGTIVFCYALLLFLADELKGGAVQISIARQPVSRSDPIG